MLVYHYSSLCSTTNPTSANMGELVKGKCKWCRDHSSSPEDELPELPMRGYLQDNDFMKQEFLVDPHSASVAMKPASYKQPATFVNQGKVNQLTWQDKTETNDYMTLLRRPEDSDNVYQSLTYRETTSLGKDDGFQSTENIYQPLDLTRMNQSHDSSTYQTLFPFYKD